MRVVAGSARGRRIVAPPGGTVRPTSDRVREAMFNALASLDAIEGATVLDLFAGSGALGVEALSRGAAHATFVDRDRHARDAVAGNLAELGLDAASVVAADAASFLAGTGQRYSLVLCDPPYDFADWGGLLEAIAVVATPDAAVVMESARPVTVPAGWRVLREKRYGGTLVAIARPPSRPEIR